MKCDHCENEATVHEVTVRNGVRLERNMCEACAVKAGLAGAVSGQAHIAELLKGLVQPPTGQAIPSLVVTPAARGTICPTCRLTFNEFKTQGQLGCPDCYKSFDSQLTPMIARAHEGACAHVGKTPRRSASGRDPVRGATDAGAELAVRAERLRTLQKQLTDAVKSEQYELAARLRDQLKKLGG
jgi:protein arginine kinase activator